MYKEGLHLIHRIEQYPGMHSFALQHIYREFNAHADSIANGVLNQAGVTTRVSDDVVRSNWDPLDLPAAIWNNLLDPESIGVDHEGNYDMPDSLSGNGSDDEWH